MARSSPTRSPSKTAKSRPSKNSRRSTTSGGKSFNPKDSSQERLLGPGKTAELLGVHISTLRRWDEDGTLEAVRTPGGWRKYRLSDIERFQGRESPEREKQEIRAVAYCRVSSHDQKQKGDLERQSDRVVAHVARQGYKLVDALEEVGSGMSDTRPKLHRLFKLVGDHEVDVVVVEHKDRLCRFNFGFLQAYFQSHGVEVEWIEDVLGRSYEEELVEDMLSLMSSFSARIYGKRSAENRRKKRKKEKAA